MVRASATLSIGEVAERTGVRTSALRYYERLGLLPAPERIGGQRRYVADAVKQVRFIQAARRVGFSLEEMKLLLSGSTEEVPCADRIQEFARRKLEEVEALISRANAMKRILEIGLTCQCLRLDDCMLFFPEEDEATRQ